jgi:plasmid stabilization system protein ParE
MNVEFLAVAEAELAEAVSYYNEQSEGLGYDFAGEVRQTIARIVRFPEAWTKLSERTRRCRAKRFPYGLVYQIRSNAILIVAVMHLRRHPESWRSRLRRGER